MPTAAVVKVLCLRANRLFPAFCDHSLVPGCYGRVMRARAPTLRRCSGSA
jgi:hypothetical protein